MKILIDLTSLYGHLSGMERFAKELSSSLIRNHPENKYILIFKNELDKDYKNLNARKIVIKGKNKLVFNQLLLPKVLNSIEADLYLFLAFPAPVFFAKKNSITMIHDMSPWECGQYMKTLSRLYFKISIRHAFNHSNLLLTNSNYSRDRIGSFSKKSKTKTSVVYCGFTKIESKENDEKILKKYKLPKNYLLSLSTLEPRKNLDLLLKVYEKIINEEANVELPKLVLAGRMGWKMKNFLDGFSEKLKQYLIFTDFIDDEDLPIVYKNADLFIFPSRYEGFGMPAIEAMGYGTMVLSSDTTAMPEILSDASLYFENENENSLYNELCKALKMTTAEKMVYIEKGYERAKLYSWDREAEKLMKIINDSKM